MKILKTSAVLGLRGIVSSFSDNSIVPPSMAVSSLFDLAGNYCKYNYYFEKILRSFKFEDSESVDMISKNEDLIFFLNDLMDITASFNYSFSAVVRCSDLITDDGHKVFVRYSALKIHAESIYMTCLNPEIPLVRNRDLYKLMMKKLIKRTKKTRTSIILGEVI